MGSYLIARTVVVLHPTVFLSRIPFLSVAFFSGWRVVGLVMLFCPNCANVVTVLPSSISGENKWTCPTCPFEFPMVNQVTSRMYLERKQVDDVMGGEDSWKNVDSTDGTSAFHLLTPISHLSEVR